MDIKQLDKLRQEAQDELDKAKKEGKIVDFGMGVDLMAYKVELAMKKTAFQRIRSWFRETLADANADWEEMIRKEKEEEEKNK